MTALAMHDVQPVRPTPASRPSSAAPSLQRPSMEVRHLILDMCASHPAQANGVYTVARQLALEQTRFGDTASLIFLCSPDEKVGAESIGVPITICPVAAPKVRGQPIYLPTEIASAITSRAGPSTIFHIHGGRTPLLIHVARALRRKKLPYAVTVHGRYSHVFDNERRIAHHLPALYLKWVESHALEGAVFVHAVSPLEHDILHQLSPKASIEFVANAAYSSAFDSIPPPPDRISPSTHFPLFGFCGRLEVGHKGLDLLVGGFARYRRGGGKGRLAIFGTGPAHAQIAAMVAAEGIEDNTELHGPRFGAAKFETLKQWDYFVMPSRYDGMPIAALEAALVGVPLILSSATGLGDYIGRFSAGDVITPLSADGVAAAMQRAESVSADAWRERSFGAYRMALATGDWTKVAERLRTLYERR